MSDFPRRSLSSLLSGPLSRLGVPICGMVLGLLAGAGCGGGQKTPPQNQGMAAGNNVQAPPPVDRSRCKSDGKQVIAADANQDKKPDVWKYYVPNGAGAQVATCKQVDLNFDGKVDVTYYFDESGTQSALEEMDLDFDGRIDLTVYYSNGKKVREEKDMNYDGRPDVWSFYEDGKLVRSEFDRDGNGRVDQWEYYENGKLDRIGYDTSGSGRVDKWDRAPEGGVDELTPAAAPASAAPAAPAPPPPTGTPPAATPTTAAPVPTAPAAAAKK